MQGGGLFPDVDKGALGHVFQEGLQVFLREDDAAVRAAELAPLLEESGLCVVGSVDDDGAGAGVQIGCVEAVEADGTAMLAGIFLGREVGALRAGGGAGDVREFVEIAVMVGVGAAAMGGAEGFYAAGDEVTT